MPKYILRVALLMSFLLWPFSALATSNVTGLSARFEGGQVTVRWGEVEDADTYRVYYGQKSILENDGAYDDFVMTDGKDTELVLTDFPPHLRQIFVAVLAVNANGEESHSFVEEVQLDMTGDATDGEKTEKEAPSPSRRERESTTMGLLSAVAQSSNVVQLTFSLNVQVPEDRAIDAFTVIDTHDNPLRLTRIVIEGTIVTLTTEDQVPGQKYAVRVNDPVTSDPLVGSLFPMDSARNTATFMGYGQSEDEAPAAEPNSVIVAAETAISQRADTAQRGLFDSGMPILGVLMAFGAIIGWRLFPGGTELISGLHGAEISAFAKRNQRESLEE